MSSEPVKTPAFQERPGNEMPGYRRFSLWGPAALVAGTVSALAMVNPLCWPIAGFGLLVCVLALQSLARRDDTRSAGRLMATVGLTLSLIFVTAAPTNYLLRQWHIRQQAAVIGSEWLGYFLSGRPTWAYESLYQVEARHPFDPGLVALYQSDPTRTQLYRGFVNSSLTKALTLLPRMAQVRHYETEKVESSAAGEGDIITEVYAVTYVDAGQRKSFFVRVVLYRRDDPTSVRGLWQVIRYEGGIRPLSLPPG